ncbi:MAG: hypothetical protein HC828_19570 [Blastochloris sp.]|nr:hypothetical protein [Blastochloris sp.]
MRLFKINLCFLIFTAVIIANAQPDDDVPMLSPQPDYHIATVWSDNRLQIAVDQDTNLQPIFTEYFPVENLSWSSDSRVLLFQIAVPGLAPSERSWYAYNPATSALSESSTWPLQPDVTNATRQQFELSALHLGGDHLAFSSPNGRFLVTDREEAHSERQIPIVVDLQTNRSVSIDVSVNVISFNTDQFEINWSGNSEAFVLSTAAILGSEPEFFQYVTGYGSVPSEVEVQELFSVRVDEREYTPLEIYDVSFAGDQTLLHGIHYAPSPTNRQVFYPLIFWDADGQHQVLQDQFDKQRGNLLAASFASDDENYILAVDDRGLVRYSLIVSSLEVLRSDLNSNRFSEALFSPDGRSLALVEAVPGYENVYVVHVG